MDAVLFAPIATPPPPPPPEPVNYDRSGLDRVAAALLELRTYAGVSGWIRQAKEEESRMQDTFQGMHDIQRSLDETLANLSAELDYAEAEFKKQPYLKRVFGHHDPAKAVREKMQAYRERRSDIQIQESALRELSIRLQKFVDYANEFAPKS